MGHRQINRQKDDPNDHELTFQLVAGQRVVIPETYEKKRQADR